MGPRGACVVYLTLKLTLTLLTFYGDTVDKPANLGFGLTTNSASQDTGLVRREDQVPRSADPEWSRCEGMKGVISTLLLFSISTSVLNLHHHGLRTFDDDFNDVVCGTQPVCGCAAVVSSVRFHHVGNLECFLEGLKGYPTARQLSSILLPGDIWSRPAIDKCKHKWWL